MFLLRPTRQLFVAGCVYLGQLLVGFTAGWTAPVVPKLQDVQQTPLEGAISDLESSWTGSLVFIGSIIGPLAVSSISNIFGRKPCLFLGGLVMAVAYLTLALANSMAMILVGRAISGLGLGILFVINLVYIGEIATTSIRGVLLTMTAIFNGIGTVLVYSVGPYVSYATINYIGLAIAIMHMLYMLFVPETPLFLVLKGKEDKVKQSLQFLNREKEYDSVLQAKREFESTTNNCTELFTIKSNRKALFITLSLHLLQQFSGFTTLAIFITTIFQRANMSIDPNISTIIVGTMELVTGCVVPFFVEKSGRKFLLLLSTATCFFSLALLATYFYLDSIHSSTVDDVKWLPLLTLVTFTVGYASGFSIIPGTFIGEMFTPASRSSGATLSLSISWAVGFGLISAFGLLMQFGTYVLFYVYTVACLVAFLFTLVFVPETKGKSLVEVQKMLG